MVELMIVFNNELDMHLPCLHLQDSKLLLWDMKGKLLKAFSGQSVISLRSCSFSADGNFVVS